MDDDEWIRDSLTLYFCSEGCHLLALGTAEEGMELLKRENFEIVITDYRLPGMDGIISHTKPEYGLLCEEYEEKEPSEKDK